MSQSNVRVKNAGKFVRSVTVLMYVRTVRARAVWGIGRYRCAARADRRQLRQHDRVGPPGASIAAGIGNAAIDATLREEVIPRDEVISVDWIRGDCRLVLVTIRTGAARNVGELLGICTAGPARTGVERLAGNLGDAEGGRESVLATTTHLRELFLQLPGWKNDESGRLRRADRRRERRDTPATRPSHTSAATRFRAGSWFPPFSIAEHSMSIRLSGEPPPCAVGDGIYHSVHRATDCGSPSKPDSPMAQL